MGTPETAVLGGGCFWCLEAVYNELRVVEHVISGYAGGSVPNPSYEAVCSGRTGHAEVVQVEYEPSEVTYEQLLDVFWNNHNPTTLNRQGPDVGTQYRSAIFYHTPEQQRVAEKSKARLAAEGKFARPIVTEITPASDFYRAEEYHQRYLEKHGLAHCHV